MSAETRNLRLERRDQADESTVIDQRISISPALGEDYWSYRVGLTEANAVVGFPKHGTIGIGFAVEEDWNTNLPYSMDTKAIRRHIWHNRGDEQITEEMVEEAIDLIKAAVLEDGGPRG